MADKSDISSSCLPGKLQKTLDLKPLSVYDAENYNCTSLRHTSKDCPISKEFQRTNVYNDICDETLQDFQSNSCLLILFTLTYEDDQLPWTCEKCVKLSQTVRNHFFKLWNCDKLEVVLSKEVGLLAKIIKVLNSMLKKEVWKQYPASYTAFVSLVCNCGWDKLTPHIPEIFPIILWMIDDYNPDVNLQGLRALEALLKLVPSAELRMYGRTEVLYDALSSKLYLRNAKQLEKVVECFLGCIKILERFTTERPHQLTRYDKLIQTVLSHIAACNDVSLMRVYLYSLEITIAITGSSTTKHLKYLIPIMEHCIEMSDTESNCKTLEIIKQLAEDTWPRFKVYIPFVMQTFIKKLMTATNCDDRFVSQLIDTIIFLKRFDSGSIDDIMGNIKAQEIFQKYSFVEQVIQKTSENGIFANT